MRVPRTAFGKGVAPATNNEGPPGCVGLKCSACHAQSHTCTKSVATATISDIEDPFQAFLSFKR
eukprot:1174547-Heterocapsa_arctica.AAC.1